MFRKPAARIVFGLFRVRARLAHTVPRKGICLWAKALVAATVLLALKQDASAQRFGCINDSIGRNSGGETLQMLSGRTFDTLAGDQINAYLWLPASSVVICGPIPLNGQRYAYYRIINTSARKSVNAWMRSGSSITPGTCYESSILRPQPFMGNSGELFMLQDGTVWEVGIEYSYLYAYYPSIIACPDQNFVVVEGQKMSARFVRR